MQVPKFTPEQVAWLEFAYPEYTQATMSPNEMYYQAGRRSVVTRIKFAMEEYKAKVPK